MSKEEVKEVEVEETEVTINQKQEEKTVTDENEEELTATQEELEKEDEVSEVEELQAALKESEDKYYRVHADFENIKKRLEREKYQAIEYASERFAGDLLAPVDSLQMALKSAKKEGASAEELLEKLVEGIELTQKQLMTALDKNGVKKVDCSGELNPNIHEAVMRVDSEDIESGHIVQVMQTGYTYKERTLRAAMVSVAN